jgi:hypothetical protein
MNVSSFIGISSAVLLAWLGVTFFHQVSKDPYPKQNRESAGTADIAPIANKETITVSVIE